MREQDDVENIRGEAGHEHQRHPIVRQMIAIPQHTEHGEGDGCGCVGQEHHGAKYFCPLR
jgi:hypothetical protein